MAGPNTSSPLRSQQCESLRENGGEMTSGGLKEVMERWMGLSERRNTIKPASGGGPDRTQDMD